MLNIFAPTAMYVTTIELFALYSSSIVVEMFIDRTLIVINNMLILIGPFDCMTSTNSVAQSIITNWRSLYHCCVTVRNNLLYLSIVLIYLLRSIFCFIRRLFIALLMWTRPAMLSLEIRVRWLIIHGIVRHCELVRISLHLLHYLLLIYNKLSDFFLLNLDSWWGGRNDYQEVN